MRLVPWDSYYMANLWTDQFDETFKKWTTTNQFYIMTYLCCQFVNKPMKAHEERWKAENKPLDICLYCISLSSALFSCCHLLQ